MSTSSKHKVAVVGLGYVGLPLAVLASQKGYEVLGIDIDAAKVDLINRQVSPLPDRDLADSLKKYPIAASTEVAAAAQAPVVVIAVPTPVDSDNQPDLQPLISAITSLLPHLYDGQLLAVESTVNPGVMDEVVKPLVAERPDISVHLVHCPERINPGDPHWTVSNIPRVLGGYSKAGTKLALDFYTDLLDAPVKVMASATEAEAVKIMENTFRDVNIAFVNEMAKSFDKLGIDITNVIEGAATKPFAFMPHYPGNGVGGHCISVDPYYMIERARQVGFDHQFLKLARQINDSMPAYSVDLLTQGLQNAGQELTGADVAILGVAYKKNVADTRNSPALKTIELLKASGANVHVYDPYTPALSTVDSLDHALSNSQAIILACDHDELVAGLTADKLQQHKIQVIIDGKNALDPTQFSQILYYGIGRAKQAAPQPAESVAH